MVGEQSLDRAMCTLANPSHPCGTMGAHPVHASEPRVSVYRTLVAECHDNMGGERLATPTKCHSRNAGRGYQRGHTHKHRDAIAFQFRSGSNQPR
jgi:hypothetical protein